MNESVGVVVIGAGQSGLAMGYHLGRQGVEHVILESGNRVGDSWRSRWDSLTLFTPARYSGLPGLSFPADPDHYPTKDEVADYLESYAARYSLPVSTQSPVHALRPNFAGGFEIESSAGSWSARQVIVATGGFQSPRVPALGERLDPSIVQMHSSQYRRPDDLPDGDVLVVGGGNSGVQIAAELALTRRTHLSIASRMGRLPQRWLGRSIFWWLDRAGVMNVPVTSAIGRRASTREFLIGESPQRIARAHGVRLVQRAVDAVGGRIRTADGAPLNVAAVVWATGFRPDFHWIEAPVLDPAGRPRHRRGVTDVPGLHFLGLSWLHTRGSALIGWVGRDAEFLARRIVGRMGRAWIGTMAPAAAETGVNLLH